MKLHGTILLIIASLALGSRNLQNRKKSLPETLAVEPEPEPGNISSADAEATGLPEQMPKELFWDRVHEATVNLIGCMYGTWHANGLMQASTAVCHCQNVAALPANWTLMFGLLSVLANFYSATSTLPAWSRAQLAGLGLSATQLLLLLGWYLDYYGNSSMDSLMRAMWLNASVSHWNPLSIFGLYIYVVFARLLGKVEQSLRA